MVTFCNSGPNSICWCMRRANDLYAWLALVISLAVVSNDLVAVHVHSHIVSG